MTVRNLRSGSHFTRATILHGYEVQFDRAEEKEKETRLLRIRLRQILDFFRTASRPRRRRETRRTCLIKSVDYRR